MLDLDAVWAAIGSGELVVSHFTEPLTSMVSVNVVQLLNSVRVVNRDCLVAVH